MTGLARRGVELAVVAAPSEPDARKLHDMGARLTHADLHKDGANAVAALRAAIAEHRPEIVHVLTSRALRALRAAGDRHGARVVYYRGKVERPRAWHPGDRRKYLSTFIDRIVCVSDAVARALVDGGVARERVCTIRKGHDPAWYQLQASDLHTEIGVEPDRFVAAVVANVRTEKGTDETLDAAALLAARGRPVAWAFIGRDQRRPLQRWRRPLAQRGVTYALGFRADAPRLLRSADCLVNASHTEGLPKAVIEAMMCRVPVVATAVGGTTELIENGVTGLLIPPRSPEAIAAAVEQLHEDRALARKLTDQAYEWAARELAVDRMVQATLDLYAELAPS